MATENQFDTSGLAGLADFTFKKFITLSVIRIVYILAIILSALMWLAVVIQGFNAGAATGIGTLIGATIGLLFYIIMVRMTLELIVVIFRIGENTSKMVELAGGKPAESSVEG